MLEKLKDLLNKMGLLSSLTFELKISTEDLIKGLNKKIGKRSGFFSADVKKEYIGIVSDKEFKMEPRITSIFSNSSYKAQGTIINRNGNTTVDVAIYHKYAFSMLIGLLLFTTILSLVLIAVIISTIIEGQYLIGFYFIVGSIAFLGIMFGVPIFVMSVGVAKFQNEIENELKHIENTASIL